MAGQPSLWLPPGWAHHPLGDQGLVSAAGTWLGVAATQLWGFDVGSIWGAADGKDAWVSGGWVTDTTSLWDPKDRGRPLPGLWVSPCCIGYGMGEGW